MINDNLSDVVKSIIVTAIPNPDEIRRMSHAGGVKIDTFDLLPFVQWVEIVEDIMNPVIVGRLSLVINSDAREALEGLKFFIGYTLIEITLQNPGDEEAAPVIHNFVFFDQVTAVDGDKFKEYEIIFVSPEYFNNKNVSKAIGSDERISNIPDIVNNVIKKDLLSKKKIKVSSIQQGIRNYIADTSLFGICYAMCPMMWRNSDSDLLKTKFLYFFFENLKGYNFVSAYDMMYSDEAIAKRDKNTYSAIPKKDVYDAYYTLVDIIDNSVATNDFVSFPNNIGLSFKDTDNMSVKDKSFNDIISKPEVFMYDLSMMQAGGEAKIYDLLKDNGDYESDVGARKRDRLITMQRVFNKISKTIVIRCNLDLYVGDGINVNTTYSHNDGSIVSDEVTDGYLIKSLRHKMYIGKNKALTVIDGIYIDEALTWQLVNY